jgi:predicted O-methyltransferase YrrM
MAYFCSMDLVHPLAEQYAATHTSPDNALLQTIQQETLQQHPHAHMLSSPVQGKFLSFISCFIQPKYILEIGTFTGYSALCLAEGLSAKGELHTIELRAADAITSQKNFNASNYAQQIFLHVGNAIDIIPTLHHTWDLVFIDADKTAYTEYYEMVLPRLSKNGLIIVDNVLFHGQVLEAELKNKNAKAIDQFNKLIALDERVEQVLVTVRDGLLLIKKK